MATKKTKAQMLKERADAERAAAIRIMAKKQAKRKAK